VRIGMTLLIPSIWASVSYRSRRSRSIHCFLPAWVDLCLVLRRPCIARIVATVQRMTARARASAR